MVAARISHPVGHNLARASHARAGGNVPRRVANYPLLASDWPKILRSSEQSSEPVAMRFDQTGSQIIVWCIFTRAGDNNDIQHHLHSYTQQYLKSPSLTSITQTY